MEENFDELRNGEWKYQFVPRRVDSMVRVIRENVHQRQFYLFVASTVEDAKVVSGGLHEYRLGHRRSLFLVRTYCRHTFIVHNSTCRVK